MIPAATIALLVVALLHFYFMLLEMVFWTKPAGRKAFNLDPAFAEATKGLAANQGLYNGFLAAGLVWAALGGSLPIAVFFLTCVIVAGVFGAITVSRKIFYVQALPAILTLVLVHLH